MEEVLDNPLPDAPRRLAFAVLRVPFFLEPQYDEREPFIETNRERLIQKWGGIKGWNEQKRRHDLKGRGLDAGIPFFNLDRLVSNTMASHRLIQHIGKTYGLAVSEAVYDKLNEYYFVDGHSLNDKPRLAKVVSDLLYELLPLRMPNMKKPTENDLLNFLNGSQGREEIIRARHALDQLGIHSIPKFIIEGRTVVDGATPPDNFVKIFRDIEIRGVVHSGPVFSDLLGVDDETIMKASHLPRTNEAI
jgi:predicted DsbA family dithiol-disulfide isomerase